MVPLYKVDTHFHSKQTSLIVLTFVYRANCYTFRPYWVIIRQYFVNTSLVIQLFISYLNVVIIIFVVFHLCNFNL
jgi:hypothetical protein